MMMNSHNNDDGFDDEIFQPFKDYSIFATNKSVSEAKKSSINSSSWSSSGKLISFENSEFEAKSEVISKKKLKNRSKRVGSTCTPNEHVVAERRRREKMSQGFVALSSLIPAGMKKVYILSFLLCRYFYNYFLCFFVNFTNSFLFLIKELENIDHIYLHTQNSYLCEILLDLI